MPPSVNMVIDSPVSYTHLPLATFALETYGDDPCECFAAKGGEDSGNSQQMLERRMHKAITVMQLKLEKDVYKRQGWNRNERRHDGSWRRRPRRCDSHL